MNEKEIPFEDAMNQLEQIANELENGKLNFFIVTKSQINLNNCIQNQTTIGTTIYLYSCIKVIISCMLF